MSVFEYNKNKLKGRVSLALGSFDGLHRGHRAVLDEAMRSSSELGLKAAVMLFDVHPRLLLSGEAPPALLSEKKRKALLEEAGFEIIEASFASVKDLEPGEFFDALESEIDLRSLSCGFNFRFGKGGSGDVAFLREKCAERGVSLSVSDPVLLDGELVSSTKIRRFIENGEIRKANAMLGRFFSFSSTVVGGDKRGRLLGFPTANLLLDPSLAAPKRGVYASFVVIDGKRFPAATNVGVRPTFGLSSLLAETHVIGFDGDLYDAGLEVFLLDHLRPETAYSSAEALLSQIKADVEKAKTIYKKEFESDESTQS